MIIMTIAYLDCFSGISGDMLLAALMDAGLPIDTLQSELSRLDLQGWSIESQKVARAGLACTKVNVVLEKKEQPCRRLRDIKLIIDRASLSDSVKQKSIAIFERLARAEAAVHGTTMDDVHFHEVGAVDAIIDIVGAVIGLEHLGVSEIICSPINLGSGSIHTEHGRLPVPAPATAELLKGVPVYSSYISHELTTPTGAVIVSEMSSMFGPMPQMIIRQIGCGAGALDIPVHPNILRIFIGEASQKYEEDTSVLIETNIDDLNPQIYDHLLERLMKAGALDVFFTPVIMKKGRPGILVSALTDRQSREKVIDVIFRETTSIGLRIYEVGRRKLPREIVEVETAFGKVRVKASRLAGEVLTVSPEYDDCRRIATEKNVPLKKVVQEAKAEYLKRFKV